MPKAKNQSLVKTRKLDNSMTPLESSKKQKIKQGIQQETQVEKWFLLKYNVHMSLVWKGIFSIQSNNSEQPLILNIDNKNIYFYASGITGVFFDTRAQWHNFTKELDYYDQARLIEAFGKKIDQENQYFKDVLLKLQIDFVNNVLDVFDEDLEQGKDALNQADIAEFAKVKKLLGELNRDFNSLSSSIFTDKVESKKIVLRYYHSQALTWWGSTIRSENFDEEPLVLNFYGQDFYFYVSGIETENCSYNNSWINYKYRLTFDQQSQLLKKLAQKINQNDLYQQNTLLKLKIDFTHNAVKFLFNNFKETKNSWIVDTELSKQEIEDYENQLKSLVDKTKYLYANDNKIVKHIDKKDYSLWNDYSKNSDYGLVNFVNPSTSQNVKLDLNLSNNLIITALIKENSKVEILKQNFFDLSKKFENLTKRVVDKQIEEKISELLVANEENLLDADELANLYFAGVKNGQNPDVDLTEADIAEILEI
ncbi:MAG: hypothetical protein REH79_00795 [Spiroplasma sp.]|nr:hypothetical protein [Spiroplasma sp.]